VYLCVCVCVFMCVCVPVGCRWNSNAQPSSLSKIREDTRKYTKIHEDTRLIVATTQIFCKETCKRGLFKNNSNALRSNSSKDTGKVFSIRLDLKESSKTVFITLYYILKKPKKRCNKTRMASCVKSRALYYAFTLLLWVLCHFPGFARLV